jgi:hypothetical protein
MHLDRRILVTGLVALAVTFVVTGTAAASVVRITKARAEINVLNAPRLVGPLNGALIDRRTGLVSRNSTSVCWGRGRAVNGRWSQFVCTIAHGKVRLRVLYLARSKTAFTIQKFRN